MKKGIFIFLFSALALISQAQVLSPVLWTFSSKKIGDKSYEIRLTANIQKSWHMYSQTQPADAIVNPTVVSFKTNPLVKLDGKLVELGKLELYKDKKLGISANQYSDKLEYVQKVKLKSSAKTKMVGSVEFQTCDDKKCLPSKKVDFSIALD
ncbi:MAG: hypothetical protein IPI66_05915 [Chitinophagaceae bacterium]|nr:hypothetical protein [Chitinophagaceae bacterium]MBL0055872.1 hypothetical protein [Chitinophagaceae bacterium]